MLGGLRPHLPTFLEIDMQKPIALFLSFALTSAAFAGGCIVKQGNTYSQVPCPNQKPEQKTVTSEPSHPQTQSQNQSPSVVRNVAGGIYHRETSEELQEHIYARARSANPCLWKHCCDQSHRDYGRPCTPSEQSQYQAAINACVAKFPGPQRNWASEAWREHGGCS
jgi:hypothetical protein